MSASSRLVADIGGQPSTARTRTRVKRALSSCCVIRMSATIIATALASQVLLPSLGSVLLAELEVWQQQIPCVCSSDPAAPQALASHRSETFSDGVTVFATVRKETDADKIRADNLIPLPCDVTIQDEVQALHAKVEAELQSRPELQLTGIVNNAGILMNDPDGLTSRFSKSSRSTSLACTGLHRHFCRCLRSWGPPRMVLPVSLLSALTLAISSQGRPTCRMGRPRRARALFRWPPPSACTQGRARCLGQARKHRDGDEQGLREATGRGCRRDQRCAVLERAVDPVLPRHIRRMPNRVACFCLTPRSHCGQAVEVEAGVSRASTSLVSRGLSRHHGSRRGCLV